MATRWRPLTCPCVVVYDSKVVPPMTEPQIVLDKFEHTCGIHESIADPQERFEAVKAHNRANSNGG